MLDPDYFARKRAELGLDRADVLTRVQSTLDNWYGKEVARVRKVNRGVLYLMTPNSSVASDLRLRQRELLALHADDVADQAITRLSISVSTLR